LSTIKSARLLAVIGLLAFSGLTVLSAVPTAFAAKSIGCGSAIKTSIVLTSDIGPCSGNGLNIKASGITIDCAGHTIQGPGSNTGYKGIVFVPPALSHDLSGVTVKNCAVTGFEYGYYITRATTNDSLVNDVANGNTYGFYLHGVTDIVLKFDTANSNSQYGYYNHQSRLGSGNTFIDDECSGNLVGGSSPTGLCTPQP